MANKKRDNTVLNRFAERVNIAYGRSEYEDYEDFGDSIGASVNTVYNYLNGRSSPRIEDLRRIARALNVTTDWLLFMEDDDG